MPNPAKSELAALIDRLHAFRRAVSRSSPVAVTTPPPRDSQPAPREADIIRRLGKLRPDFATSFRQVLVDLDSPRASYVGPVGEAREVLRAAVHRLAPDAAVKARPWFKGVDGKPTQAERARYAARKRSGKDADEAADAVETFEAKLGKLFRTVYGTASKNLHAGTQKAEAQRIVGYVVVILDDILPD